MASRHRWSPEERRRRQRRAAEGRKGEGVNQSLVAERTQVCGGRATMKTEHRAHVLTFCAKAGWARRDAMRAVAAARVRWSFRVEPRLPIVLPPPLENIRARYAEAIDRDVCSPSSVQSVAHTLIERQAPQDLVDSNHWERILRVSWHFDDVVPRAAELATAYARARYAH